MRTTNIENIKGNLYYTKDDRRVKIIEVRSNGLCLCKDRSMNNELIYLHELIRVY